MSDEAMWGWFIDHIIYYVAIYNYTSLSFTQQLCTTKYAESPGFSGFQYLKKWSIKNNMGIIGNDVRIK